MESATVIEKPAWERGIGQWCSTTPCCGREVHTYDAYHHYLGTVRRAWLSPDADPDPENHYAWFWVSKDCRGCATVWEVSFEFAEFCYLGPPGRQGVVDAEPVAAFWRKLGPQPSPASHWMRG